MGTLAVVFIQPAFRDLPCFIHRSEQVEIQDLCPIRPVELFNKRILRRLTRLDKFQYHTMLFSALCKCQREQFWAIVHPQFQRILPVRHCPAQHSDHPLRRDIQINLYCRASRLKSSTTLKVRKRLPHTSASCIQFIDQLWLSASGVTNGTGLHTGRRCFPLSVRIVVTPLKNHPEGNLSD